MVITLSFLLIIGLLFSQEIPQEFFSYYKLKLEYDNGQNWDSNSTFGPIRWRSSNIIIYGQDSLKVYSRSGIFGNIHNDKRNSIAVYGYANLSYRHNFYAYIYPRIVSDPEGFSRYTGIPRKISRFGFNSGETDLAGIGYEDEWFLFQLGRGRQSWGAGNDIQLVLSEESPSYDYGMLTLDFGTLKCRYFHGFLEKNIETDRYITGRGVEWTNQRTLIMSLSEIVIYSGVNRPLDFAYFNPMSTHLEIELNDRQNRLGTDSGNGVWQASIDWMIKNNIRFSGNILIDEFVLDDIQKDSGKVHSMAWSIRTAWTPIKRGNIITIIGSWSHVGSNTFRHGVGNNNFVHRGMPLGWYLGSDGEELNIGMYYFHFEDIIASLEIGSRKIGSGSITYDPYEPYFNYENGSFPSGDVDKTLFIRGITRWWWKQNISINGVVELTRSSINGASGAFKIGFDIYYPRSFSI